MLVLSLLLPPLPQPLLLLVGGSTAVVAFVDVVDANGACVDDYSELVQLPPKPVLGVDDADTSTCESVDGG